MLLLGLFPVNMRAAELSFSFGAVGDLGTTNDTSSTLQRLSGSNTSFFLALGDLSYRPPPETQWCDFVTAAVGLNYPFELVPGNHEDNGLDGLIDNFAQCLPDRIGGVFGTYPKEYYFDYPTTNPLARFILISPDLNFTNGGVYDYSVGSSHYIWTSGAIDDARAKQIPWVVVGMHKVCISTGTVPCDIGPGIKNLLMAKKVDLVLQAHEHSYQRSKQLICARVRVFDSACVVNDGSTNVYTKDVGTVFVIAGVGGESLSPIDISDPENGYFTDKVMGSNTTGSGFGFVKYTVRADRIDVQTAFSGTFYDSFAIVKSLSADFTFSSTQPVVGESVSFTGTAAGGTAPYIFSWTFGDGLTGSGATVSHIYSREGIFTVTLTVTDSASGIATPSKSIVVHAALTVDFSFAPTNPVVGEAVSFSATGTGGTLPYAHGWSFGDGASDSGATVDHTYTSAGAFTVVLTTSDATGHTATASKSILVTPPLIVDFSFAPTNPVVGEAVSFSASASGGTPPYGYIWAFGDGLTGSGATVSHAYASVGALAVGLEVSDSAGHTTMVTKSVSVAPLLVVDFSFAPTQPVPGETVPFAGTATGGISPYFYRWTFGDGGTAMGAAVGHAFAIAGTYEVTLTVSDSAGHVVPVAKSILVPPSLTADFSFSPTKPVTLEVVNFGADASGGASPYAFAWDFGDGSRGSGGTVSHAYASVRSFDVRLTVSDSAGHAVAVTESIPVTPPLVADFSFTPARPLLGESIMFSGTATGGIPPYAWAWTFGDKSTDSGVNATHDYSVGGSFVVALEVSDSEGHVNLASRSLVVSPSLTADFVFTPAYPVLREDVSFTADASGGTPPYDFAWAFGEGSLGVEAEVIHAYVVVGSFTVTLQVSDSVDHMIAVPKTIVVVLPVFVDFTLSPAQLFVGDAITFTPIPSGGTPPYSYGWSFGDGAASRDARPTHRYGVSGLWTTYSVLLIACDSTGHCATTAKEITVWNLPPLVGIVVIGTIVSVVVLRAVRRPRRRKGAR